MPLSCFRFLNILSAQFIAFCWMILFLPIRIIVRIVSVNFKTVVNRLKILIYRFIDTFS